MDATAIITQGAAASVFAKVLVDVVKVSPVPSPGIVLPVLAFIFSEGAAFLLLMASVEPFTRQSVSLTVLVGIAATAGAMGTTALQNQANQ
jgi:ABC-type Fe3+-siderophore transport system permease subunit